MTTAVATRPKPGAALSLAGDFSPDQVQLLKDTICQGATNDELSLFMHTANRLQLDPFARQIFAVKRWDGKLKREVMNSQVSIDGFRLVAERTGKYEGQDGPFWCGADGKWVDVWLQSTPPAAAKVGVRRRGFEQPLYRTATWAEFVQVTDEKDERGQKSGKKVPNAMWRKMGALMLAKCAESQALRAAFPNELSGVYTQEEMGQAIEVEGEVLSVTPGAAPATPGKQKAAEIRQAARKQKNEQQAEGMRPTAAQGPETFEQMPAALQGGDSGPNLPEPTAEAVEDGDAKEPDPPAPSFITEQQRKNLFARANERDLQGDTMIELKKIIQFVKDVPLEECSTKKLTPEDFTQICEELAAYPYKESK